jgi:hypothetical protein
MSGFREAVSLWIGLCFDREAVVFLGSLWGKPALGGSRLSSCRESNRLPAGPPVRSFPPHPLPCTRPLGELLGFRHLGGLRSRLDSPRVMTISMKQTLLAESAGAAVPVTETLVAATTGPRRAVSSIRLLAEVGPGRRRDPPTAGSAATAWRAIATRTAQSPEGYCSPTPRGPRAAPGLSRLERL